jgi:hypothetical protein
VRDPHINKMFYSISAGEGISYSDPEPLSFSNRFGSFYLADGELCVMPADHFSSEQEARDVLEPYLKAWEIESDLTRNVGMIRFEFLRAELIDRNPPLENSHIVGALFGSCAIVQSHMTAELVCRKYPDPPLTFYSSSEVQLAHHRWIQYQVRKEPLPSMAYYVFTLAREMARGGDVSDFFRISRPVLRKISELSSKRGNESSARKAGSVPFSSKEEQWLEEAIRKLIIRMAERTAGQNLHMIFMNNLPPLE